MNAGKWIAAGLWIAVAACSSKSPAGFGGGVAGSNAPGSGSSGGSGSTGGSSGGMTSGSGGGAGGSSSGVTGSSGGAAGQGSGGDGGAGVMYGDAAASDANLGTPVTLTMDAFSVPANSEVYMCQQFGNPFGADVDLVKMVGSMSQGSHHFFLFNMSPSTGRTTSGPIGACPDGGLEFHPFPYLSQQPEWTVQYGAGMGYPLIGQNGLMMNVHYLNTSAQPVTPKVTITIYPARAGTVTTHVGTVFLNTDLISVAAGTTTPVAVSESSAPITDEDYTIFTNWSHMHMYATDFKASANGSVFYEETTWQEPPLITAGSDTSMHESPLLPLAMKSGEAIEWTCMYTNPTAQTMTFGESAQTSDMCIYMGQYYPADGTPSTNPNYPDVLMDVPQIPSGF